jgi:hypothetical protein
MSLSPGKNTLILAPLILIATPAFAGYEYPLPSPEIRNAYFLGTRNNYQTVDFLSAYAHRIQEPQNSDYTITEIDTLTPYAQVVQRGAKNTPGDSEVQTETDLASHPLRFVVKVQVIFNSVLYGDSILRQGSSPDFSIEVKQGQKLAPLKMAGYPFWSESGPSGVDLVGEFDPAKIASAPMHITVHTPDGKSIKTDFDLTKLK